MPIQTRADWEKLRAQTLDNMQLVMGPLTRVARQALDIVVLEEERLANFVRKKITFAPEANDRVPAYLLIPVPHARRLPAMLCLHQTTPIGKAEPAGLGGKADLQYAAELAGHGYVTLAPDYPGFGDYHIDPYVMGYASATMKGIRNHMRAVDVLASMPEVDAARIGAIGHSLGGHNALFAATFDRRLRAVITSCGFTSFAKYKGGDLTGWSHRGYMPRIATHFDKSPARMPFDFPDILAALAPRPVFINAPLHDSNFEVSGVKECVNAAVAVYQRVFSAAERLVAVYPDAAHEFPPDVRQAAYRFLDRWLNQK
jgi:dienelactone hydrolase